MKTQDTRTSTIGNQTPACSVAIGGTRIMQPLADGELEYVAAAGAKKGVAPGNYNDPRKT